MRIEKPIGITHTEQWLSQLCERTFLKLWSWLNTRKRDGKELCDLIAVFDDHVFIFFDRENRAFGDATKDISVTWRRWKKEVIDKQIRTARGAERYIMRGEKVFVDSKREQLLPIMIPRDAAIHKIIVAHGAVEACKSSSAENVYGSLAVSYKNRVGSNPPPFFVELERAERIHVLDSFNLEIVLSELDTFSDFTSYIEEKESAIAKYDVLAYCGEEDLLAHYLMNYDQYFKRYRIGNSDPNINCVMIGEGEWKAYVEDGYQAKRSQANKQSYLWDEFIQRTYQNALDGTTTGASLWDGRDALHEMAREPRLSRRALADQMLEAIRRFPKIYGHRVTYMPSIESDKSYVFLQVRFPAAAVDCGEVRRRMLEIACGVTRNMFSHLGIVVGITLDAPLYASSDGEDFLLLDCEYWSEEQRAYFNRANDQLGFFKNARKIARSTADFA